MAIIQVNLTDTINSFRVKTNTLALQVGDTALLDTSGADSNTVSSINSRDGNVDSAMIPGIALDSDSVLNHMIGDDQVDSSHILDSSITNQMIQQDAVEGDNIDDSAVQGYHFDAMTVLKVFASNGTELRKIYGPARFDNDSANTFRTNPWV